MDYFLYIDYFRILGTITLKVNELAVLIKRHRMADWIKKQEPTICFLQKTHLGQGGDTHRLKVRGQKKLFQANGNIKSASSNTDIRKK